MVYYGCLDESQIKANEFLTTGVGVRKRARTCFFSMEEAFIPSEGSLQEIVYRLEDCIMDLHALVAKALSDQHLDIARRLQSCLETTIEVHRVLQARRAFHN